MFFLFFLSPGSYLLAAAFLTSLGFVQILLAALMDMAGLNLKKKIAPAPSCRYLTLRSHTAPPVLFRSPGNDDAPLSPPPTPHPVPDAAGEGNKVSGEYAPSQEVHEVGEDPIVTCTDGHPLGCGDPEYDVDNPPGLLAQNDSDGEGLFEG